MTRLPKDVEERIEQIAREVLASLDPKNMMPSTRELTELGAKYGARFGFELAVRMAADVCTREHDDHMKWAAQYSKELQEKLSQEAMVSAGIIKELAEEILALLDAGGDDV